MGITILAFIQILKEGVEFYSLVTVMKSNQRWVLIYHRTGIFLNFLNFQKKYENYNFPKFFQKNFQTIGFFTAQQRTHELLVNDNGNHNALLY